MTADRGPSTITFRGREIQRVHGFVELPTLSCPLHHRLKLGGFTIHGAGGLTCHNKASPGGPECGALLWLLQVPVNRQTRRFYAADVTWRELQLWEERGYTAEDVLRYLGAWFSRSGDAVPPLAMQRRVG
jgi:hypothetical protein